MKYSYYLEGTLVGGQAYEDVQFNIDLRTLIPASLIEKRFILRTCFASRHQLTAVHSTIRVSVNIPSGINKQYLSTTYNNNMVVGFTRTVFNSYNHDYNSHQYMENECMERVVRYPTFYPLIVSLYSFSGTNLLAGTLFGLNLSFELIPEDNP